MISKRLKQLRLARGLSLDALAAAMGGLITKQALSKYEQGIAKPTSPVLIKLAAALGVKAAHLWSEPTVQVHFIAYRKGSGLTRKEQMHVESLVAQVLEDRVRLQKLTLQQNGSSIPVQTRKVSKLSDAEKAAEEMRVAWNLGLDPIASVTDVLEDHFVHVLEVEAGDKFDGISAIAFGEDKKIEAAGVVSKKDVPGERQRLNLAHELGHLVLKVPSGVDEEKAAFRFAGAFLAPADTIYREVGRKRAFIQFAELLLLKQKLGISIQALLYRLHDLNIISNSTYRQWCMDINRAGLKKKEPDELEPERPQWLRRTVLRAFAEGLLGKEEAERMLEDEIRAKEPLTLIERRAFMKLSLDERRKILEAQAEKAAALYSHNKDWEDIQGGDIIEYD